MDYKPEPKTAAILDRAWFWIQSVPYSVTSRWVFYRLFQEGVYSNKSGYKPLLSISSKARKSFYKEWRPWSLVDDTRNAIVPEMFPSAGAYHSALCKRVSYTPDVWQNQPIYVEVWFEAAAMEAQFRAYTPGLVSLLAFRGDVSIYPKWTTAQRLLDRWLSLQKPVHIFYFGDLDYKGLIIPGSAWRDIIYFAQIAYCYKLNEMGIPKDQWDEHLDRLLSQWNFQRVGLTVDQVNLYGLPENPERPGTWQWEALGDDQARELIGQISRSIDGDRYNTDILEADKVTERLRDYLGRWNPDGN